MKDTATVLRGVEARATKQLDGIAKHLPPLKQTLPFNEYMARATQVARTNTDFARELARSLYQMQQAQQTRS